MIREQKILVVDDSELQADILESMLHDLGARDITKDLNGVQALKHFGDALGTKKPYSLVFLDIVMPEMDGQEALKRIRSLEKNSGGTESVKTKIIMTTSLDSPESMIDALVEGGCDDYIVKPVYSDNLRVVLSRLGFL